MKNDIKFAETDARGLDLIGPLWQKLIAHHEARAPEVFAGHFDEITFDTRKNQLLEKSRNGFMRIDLARDDNDGTLVGYCVSTINGQNQGEIESIFIEADYRRQGIGDKFMKKALRWMDGHSVNRKVIAVASGNEEVFPFYRRYNFYPRASILHQVEIKAIKE